MRVVRRDESRVIDSFKEIDVDTTAAARAARERRAVGDRPGRAEGQEPRVRVRFAGPANAAPEFRVFRTDDGPRPYVVRRFRGIPPEGKGRPARGSGTAR